MRQPSLQILQHPVILVYSKNYLTDMVQHLASITAGHDDLLECTKKIPIEVISRTVWAK
jgi:hypothetical protein